MSFENQAAQKEKPYDEIRLMGSGLGYPPPTFSAVMRNIGASPTDARDVNSAIASMMRGEAMELWNMHSQVQLRVTIKRGISALDYRDKVKAAEHRMANKTLTCRQKAAKS